MTRPIYLALPQKYFFVSYDRTFRESLTHLTLLSPLKVSFLYFPCHTYVPRWSEKGFGKRFITEDNNVVGVPRPPLNNYHVDLFEQLRSSPLTEMEDSKNPKETFHCPMGLGFSTIHSQRGRAGSATTIDFEVRTRLLDHCDLSLSKLLTVTESLDRHVFPFTNVNF